MIVVSNDVTATSISTSTITITSTSSTITSTITTITTISTNESASGPTTGIVCFVRTYVCILCVCMSLYVSIYTYVWI